MLIHYNRDTTVLVNVEDELNFPLKIFHINSKNLAVHPELRKYDIYHLY